MINYPQIDPIALQLGALKIHWYGLSYLAGFAIAWLLAKYRSKKLNYDWNNEVVTDFVFHCAVGAIIGGRLGYVLFYGLSFLVQDPWFIFKIWQGGMSFHGGLLGIIIALYLFAKKIDGIDFIAVLDFAATLAPLGLAAGRVGNFINGEAFGRVTTLSWGMVFPGAGPLPRHPSQLYEALVEGLFLFIILWVYAKKPRLSGTVSGLFLVCYGVGRFFCEFFREPDSHIGFILFHQLTIGQLLSIPMVLIGLGILIRCYRKKPSN
jgi:phosphatidylglycerol:prolipoprotein diacylglycerol transferase